MRIAICGAGIAGPTLAYWLHKYGNDVLLVEEASALRTGGYVIDFWGTGYDIAERMGLLPEITRLGYGLEEVRFVDSQGGKVGGFSTAVITRLTRGRFTSLRRSDLSASIFGALDPAIERIFGDSITRIDDNGDSVRLGFHHRESRQVDLIIGADGLHSRVRQLVFGPQARVELSLGYHVAAFEVDGYRPRDELISVSYTVPGRQVSRFALRGDKTLFLFVFRDEYVPPSELLSDGDRRTVLRSAFANVGWECQGILAAMETVSAIYFDRVSQIRMDRWTQGRTALIGDAAACASLLAGEGAGLAMVEAYVLAGELHLSRGDYRGAFTRYQERLMPFLTRKQQSAAKFASSFAPKTARGIRYRNLVTRVMTIPLVADLFMGGALRDNIALPDYER